MPKNLFEKGREKTGGRVKGTLNKHTTEVKEATMKCANDPKYIAWLKENRPELFISLVKAILPKDVNLGGQEDNELTIRIRGYQGDGD
jgi:hypothetical protein